MNVKLYFCDQYCAYEMRSSEAEEYKNAVNDVVEKFKRSRIKRFVTKNGCAESDVHLHNERPIWYLVKAFKASNNLKTRTYKNITEGQKESWHQYYIDNMKLVLMTDEQHKEFHNTHEFDAKNNVWITKHFVPKEHKRTNSTSGLDNIADELDVQELQKTMKPEVHKAEPEKSKKSKPNTPVVPEVTEKPKRVRRSKTESAPHTESVAKTDTPKRRNSHSRKAPEVK